jgi:hypothetical protein
VRQVKPALIFSVAVVLTLVAIVGTQVLAWPQQQSQQPPPPVTGGGQSTGGTGVTQGQPNISPPPTPSDICSQVPQAQADFIRFTDEIKKDRQILQNIGFDRTVEDIESWESSTQNAKNEFQNEAKSFLLGKALDGLSEAARSVAPTLTQTQRGSLYTMFQKAGVNDDLLKDLSVATNPGPVHVNTFATWFAYDMQKVQQRMLDAIPDDPNTIDLFNSTLSVAELFYPEAAPLLEAVKELDSLGVLAYEAGKVGNGVYNLSKLSQVSEDQLRELPNYTNKYKADVDALNQAKRILDQAKSCDSTKLVRKPEQKGGMSNGTKAALVVLGVGGAAGGAAAAVLASQNKSSSSGQLTGQCVGTAPANACGTCTCTPNVNCNPSPQCGGDDCFTSGSPAPFCQ